MLGCNNILDFLELSPKMWKIFVVPIYVFLANIPLGLHIVAIFRGVFTMNIGSERRRQLNA